MSVHYVKPDPKVLLLQKEILSIVSELNVSIMTHWYLEFIKVAVVFEVMWPQKFNEISRREVKFDTTSANPSSYKVRE